MVYKKTNITNLVVIGVIALIGLAFVFATVSRNSGTDSTTDARARAGVPAPCTKPGTKGLISQVPGTVLSKNATNNTFVVDLSADNDKRNRVVHSCPDTEWTRAKGGGSSEDLVPMTFADLSVGDNVVIDGNYIDRDKTTIYPVTIQDMSLHPEHFRGDVSAATATQLTLINVINGPESKVSVLLLATTRCYRGVRFRDITPKTPQVICSSIKVGERLEVDGIYSDMRKTTVGPYARLVVHPKD